MRSPLQCSTLAVCLLCPAVASPYLPLCLQSVHHPLLHHPLLPGAKCGWCTQLSLDERMPDCTSSCTGAKSCSVTCPAPVYGLFCTQVETYNYEEYSWQNCYNDYNNPRHVWKVVHEETKTTDCGLDGFTYVSNVDPQGQVSATVSWGQEHRYCDTVSKACSPVNN